MVCICSLPRNKAWFVFASHLGIKLACRVKGVVLITVGTLKDGAVCRAVEADFSHITLDHHPNTLPRTWNSAMVILTFLIESRVPHLFLLELRNMALLYSTIH